LSLLSGCVLRQSLSARYEALSGLLQTGELHLCYDTRELCRFKILEEVQRCAGYPITENRTEKNEERVANSAIDAY